VLEHVAAYAPLPSHRIAGGTQGLALALAARLGDRVRLGTPVRAVEDGVVRTDAGDLEADRVILAVPLPAVAQLVTALPGWKRDALARVETGHAAKLHVPLRAAPPTSAVMSVPDRFWCWTAEAAPGEVAPVANCFAGSPRALAALDVANGPSAWLARLVAVRPELELATAEAVLTTWDDDPWAGFAYSADGLAAGAGDDEALAAPVGALHFAGEHTAGGWRALMEGALRSGIRAADEALAAS
jgi:monoamine oxidase